MATRSENPMGAEAAKASIHRKSSFGVNEDYAAAAVAGHVHPKLKKTPGGCIIAAVAIFFNVVGVSTMIAYYMALGGCDVVRTFIDGDWDDDDAYNRYADAESGYVLCTSEVYVPDKSLADDALLDDDDDDWSYSYWDDDDDSLDDSRRRLGINMDVAWVSCHLPSLKCSDYDSNGACPFAPVCSDDFQCTGAVSVTYYQCKDFFEALSLAQGYSVYFIMVGLTVGFLAYYGPHKIICDDDTRKEIHEVMFIDKDEAELNGRFESLEARLQNLEGAPLLDSGNDQEAGRIKKDLKQSKTQVEDRTKKLEEAAALLPQRSDPEIEDRLKKLEAWIDGEKQWITAHAELLGEGVPERKKEKKTGAARKSTEDGGVEAQGTDEAAAADAAEEKPPDYHQLIISKFQEFH